MPQQSLWSICRARFAALSHADYQMGRILDAIEDMGDLDNTLVIYIQGDNGASAEGGPQGLLNELTYFNGVPEDFAEILKRMDELGGPNTNNHYPIGWAHAILNGVPQKPVEGVSMVYSFDNAQAPSKHRTQYFEMFANRAIYSDGWVAATTPPVAPWDLKGKVPDIDDYQWELYNVEEDFSESVNLADKEPAKLRVLQDLFWVEAAKYNVLPVDNSRAERMDVSLRPSLTRGRSVFTYFPGQTRIPEGVAPDTKNKSFKIAANVAIPAEGAEGVIATQGGRFNGWGLYLLGSKPVFHYNLAGVHRFTIAGKENLSPGEHVIVMEFAYDGGGIGKGAAVKITVDNNPVAEGRVERSIPIRVSVDETLDIGEDTGTPVSEDYKVPFKFNGNLKRVLIGLAETKLTAEDEEEIRRAKAAIGVSQ